MQDLRWLIAWLAIGIAAQVHAQELRVLTWNLGWFPGAARGVPTTAQQEAARVAKAAATLRQVDADILILQEVRDLAACRALAEALLPQRYEVSICSEFKDVGGLQGLQQLAILSKHRAKRAACQRWSSFGVADPPRGFVHAVYEAGGCALLVYGVHLKSNLTQGNAMRAHQLNLLKRELAAEQLLQHQGDELRALGRAVMVVGGDFNTDSDQEQFFSERTLSLLLQQQFRSGFEALAPQARVTLPGSGRHADATFDYLFVKPAEAAGAPWMVTSEASDHRPVLRSLKLPAVPTPGRSP